MVGKEVLLWWVAVADWSGTGSRGAFIAQWVVVVVVVVVVVGQSGQSESSGRDY